MQFLNDIGFSPTGGISANSVRGAIIELDTEKANERDDVLICTSSATLTLANKLILANATNGTITLTLPAASTALGKVYKIKKTDNVNPVIIDGNGSETIDQETSYQINYRLQSVELACDGTEWYVM